MTIDEAREYIVIVNGGSGVIFQPADENFSYILTAKHNIKSEIINITRFEKSGDDWTTPPIEPIEVEMGINYFPHHEYKKDIAIIKIPKIEGFNSIFRMDLDGISSNNFYLLGYPQKRRDEFAKKKSLWFRDDRNLSIHGSRDYGRIEGRLQNREEYNEIVGHSGGGILKIGINKIFLLGIQNSMLSNKDYEGLGSIEFTPIKFFDEIIDNNKESLQSLYPCYIENFSFLKDDSFNVGKCINSNDTVDCLTRILKQKTTDVIESNITPLTIKNHLSERLMVLNGQDKSIILDKGIWVVWLELLTILKILKNGEISIENLSSVLSEYRLFYSDVNDDFWMNHLHELPKVNYSTLKKGGKVIVASNRPASNRVHKLSNIPPSIYKPAKKEFDINQIDIDNPDEFPFDKYKYINISAFKEGIIQERYEEFIHLEVPNKWRKLKELYKNLIDA